jgi:hypothetical protein
MKYFLLAFIAVISLSCVEEKKSDLAQETEVVDSKYHPIEVTEVIPGGGYIYIKALENNDTIWLATKPAKITVGKTYYYTEVMEMANFPSKELDRTFDKIYFLDQLLDEAREPLPGETHTQASAGQNEEIQFEAEEGITSIGELYKNRQSLAGQTVTVRGKVTKVNNDIMDRNWVHIQDGTKDGEDFDLTITTKAKVELGTMVVFTGTVAVDKDFTLGYKYKLLVENAEVPDVEM